MVKTLNLSVISAIMEFHWGFSVTLPLYTASQPSYKVPPLTTLLGALAYPALRLSQPELLVAGDLIESSVSKLLDKIIWVTGRFLNVNPRAMIEVRDLVRIITTLGIRTQNIYPGSLLLWAVQTRGKIYAPGARFESIYITHSQDRDAVERWATGIWRLGPREVPVSVVDVRVYNGEVVEPDTITTLFVTPRYLVTSIDEGDYVEENLPELMREWYSIKVKDPLKLHKRYIIPLTRIKVKIKPEEALVIRDERGEYYIIPRHRVSGYGEG